jgi:dihydroxyacetone kinase-like predicted kinase
MVIVILSALLRGLQPKLKETKQVTIGLFTRNFTKGSSVVTVQYVQSGA